MPKPSTPAFFEERIHMPERPRDRDVRAPYERDRARIVHSAAFRRLQGKTQVMGVGEGDFHRTRLTHSIECAQIGAGLRDQIERTSSAPADFLDWLPSRPLVEASCFAHDLGHPPFGHSGEKALHAQMAATGGFEGNGQTLRVLTRLEKYRDQGCGINPTRRLVLAVLKYPIAYSRFPEVDRMTKPQKCFFDEELDLVEGLLASFLDGNERRALANTDSGGKAINRSFDSSLMELADDIAYGVHDIEDIVARGLASRDHVQAALEAAFAKIGGTLQSNAGTLTAIDVSKGLFGSSFSRKQTIGRLVSAFITAVSVAERADFRHPLFRFRADLPGDHRELLNRFRQMSFRLVIDKAQVQQLEHRGQRIVSCVFDAMLADPERLIPQVSWQDGHVEASRERRVCDFLAGMTDSYSEKIYRRLFIPGFGSSSDEL